MKLHLLYPFAALLALAIGAAEAASAQEILQLPPSSAASRAIELTAIKREPVPTRISATATIEPDAGVVAEITSPIPAHVVRLVAQPGQPVKAGQPLVILSSVELGEAKTDYLKAKSLERIAGAHLAREQGLYQKKIAPMKDLLEAQAQHDTALAQFEAAREKLRVLIPEPEIASLKWSGNGRPLAEFALTSPIDGTLVKRDLTIGEMLDRADHPLKVINLTRVWIFANIFERDLSGLTIGDETRVTVDAYPDRVFTGRVAYIGDEVDRTTRTVRARIDVPNPDHLLKPGMFAHAAIATPTTHIVMVAPDSAIFKVNGADVAFVATAGDTYTVRHLQLGTRGANTVQIITGLHEGDQVVSRGGLTLKSMLANNS